MTKTDLFLKLAQPNSQGISRWVRVTEFVGEYESLKLGNGRSWCRDDSSFAKKFIVEINRSITPGNSIDAIKLNGYNTKQSFNQAIRADIKEFYRNQNCVMLGICGNSENTKIEIDHKDGRKDDWRVSDPRTQKLEDFQPLCKAANDAKRQICKRCKDTDKRWDARNIKGNPYSFYEGNENYTKDLGCKGCYQFDPVEYRRQSVKRIAKEASDHTTDYIMNKIYGDK